MSKESATDEVLMKTTASGDRDCLEQLVRRHARGLMTFIQRTVGGHHRSEELFQEVFLAVWKNRGQYEFPKPFRSWLYTIALNRCRLHFRAGPQRETPIPLSVSLVDSNVSPHDTVVHEETATLVKSAVAALPDQQRNVVVLRIWNGLSYQEIAEIVGVTEATVRSYMFHALKTLRSRLESRLR